MQVEREREYYQVFARRKADEPLQHIGTVGASEPDDGELEADGDDAAAQAALSKLGDGDWIEVQLVPEDAIRWIVRPGGAGGRGERTTMARA